MRLAITMHNLHLKFLRLGENLRIRDREALVQEGKRMRLIILSPAYFFSGVDCAHPASIIAITIKGSDDLAVEGPYLAREVFTWVVVNGEPFPSYLGASPPPFFGRRSRR